MRTQDQFSRLALLVLAIALWGQFATAQTFSATGSMATARDSHTATLLPNGKVLIVGGEDSNFDPLASAEVYNPTSGTFSATGSLANPRYLHTATLLPNGKVLVLGGFNADGAMASAEIYDPANRLFTSAGVMIEGRAMHSATALANGKILIAAGFGWDGRVNTAEIYDPATGSFVLTKGDLSVARSKQTATLLSNGKVLLAGGYGAAGPLASAELYDPATGVFASTPPMAFARYEHTATPAAGKVLMSGGQSDSSLLASAELFDPSTGSFVPVGPLAKARVGHSSAVVGGQPILLGGLGPAPLVQAELFNKVDNMFSLTGSMLSARYYATATTLTSGKVLVAGGYNSAPLASAELYTPLALPPPPPTLAVTVDYAQINLSETSILTWDSTNANEVTIDGAPVPVDGSLSVTPTSTTTYRLVAIGEAGSVQAEITVTVNAPPQAPAVSFNANHSSVQRGQSAMLTWDSTNADTVSINGSSVSVDGSMSVTPVATTTYNLTATGPGGTVRASLTLAVTAPSPGVTIDVKPDDPVNSINTKSNGRIPVAILSSASFDASTKIDVATLTFGHSGNEASLAFCNVQQVNADGLLDLLCHFDTQAAAFQPADTSATLKGKTTSGVPFEASDLIRIVNK
jgi:hypothetical protein